MPAYELGPNIMSTESADDRIGAKLGDQCTARCEFTPRTQVLLAYDVPIIVARVPWEPLDPGPNGSLFVVQDQNETRKETYAPVDLDSAEVLKNQGLTPIHRRTRASPSR